jgi:uncharacterized membrane protein YhaH (DUF805 family)
MKNRSVVIALMTITDSLGLFAVACALPALDLRAIPATGVPTPPSSLVSQAWTGFDLLLRGWAGLPVLEPAWLANPLLVLAWLALGLRRWRLALAPAAAALLHAAPSLTRETITVFTATGTTQLIVERVLPGTYVWMASGVMAVLGAVVGWLLAGRALPPLPRVPLDERARYGPGPA